MKKILKLVFLIIVILSIFLIYKFTNNKYLNYTSIGDGLSKGIDSYANIDYGYSDYIYDYLKEKDQLKLYSKDFTSQEMSINDLKSKIFLDEKVNYKNRKINLKNILSESDILTMSIGLNDLIYKLSILDIKSIKKIDRIVDDIYIEFIELITEIKKFYNGDIYLVGYYVSPKYDYKINYAIEKLNEKYKNTPDIIYIATDYFLSNNKKYLVNPNSYYPNSAGYQAISRKIITKLTKKLENSENNWYTNNAFNYYDLRSHGGRRDK